ncbi:hypothetical protein HPB52_006671 [Rhipicephalus sanguineus]|uniref:Uncharacterized protein n=1 Tax=Rhipicephalus sanguineus TaxID=34632 RepID=A0A9D4PMW1_RHISA|nr:hypothetical protein HPB52_006671 [Rhipicephalus sanguineus]
MDQLVPASGPRKNARRSYKLLTELGRRCGSITDEEENGVHLRNEAVRRIKATEISHIILVPKPGKPRPSSHELSLPIWDVFLQPDRHGACQEQAGVASIPDRLKAVKTELATLNAQLETFLTYQQAAEDYNFVMEYEDAATSTLALLEHHTNRLQAHPPATTAGEDLPATSEREPTRPQREFAAINFGKTQLRATPKLYSSR